MRDILFKAKRVDNGEWVEGFISYPHSTDTEKGVESYYFMAVDERGWYGQCVVSANTICQFTGLTDKNGQKIWENDIVKFKHEKIDYDYGFEPWKSLPNKKEYNRNYIVEFCNTPTHYGLRLRNGSIWFMVHRMTVVMHDVEVIGNIFDNPELLKGGAV